MRMRMRMRMRCVRILRDALIVWFAHRRIE